MVVVLLARGSASANIDILYLNLDAAECYCSACFRRFWNKDTEMRQLIAVNVKRWGRSGRHIKPLVCEGGEHFQSKNIKVSLLFKCMYRCDNVCKQLNLFLDHECPNMAHFLRNWAMFSTKARKLRCSGLFDNMLGQVSVQKHANEIHNPHRRHPNKKKTHKGKWERGCMDQYTQGRLIRHRSQGRESQSQWREKKKNRKWDTQGKDCRRQQEMQTRNFKPQHRKWTKWNWTLFCWALLDSSPERSLTVVSE